MSHSKHLTLHISGKDDDHGDVRFDDFIRQLEIFKHALVETERGLFEDSTVYYRVVDLRHSSPAAIELEAVGGNADAVAFGFFDAVQNIQQFGQAPQHLKYDTLAAYSRLSELFDRSVSALSVSYGDQSIPLNKSIRENVESILGPDQFEMGEFAGLLHQISLHGGKKVFTIYPTWGGPKLRCVIPDELRKKSVEAVDRYVTAQGLLKYKQMYEHPYEMDVHDIDIHPDEADLPTLFDLQGIAPGATGDLSSEEFVRQLRSKWDHD
ncbi:MAG: hypothetical protein M3Y56_09105 [Armatimonadota bacterium]|nr:hypothetical protein [Armatimonadota bacterium]